MLTIQETCNSKKELLIHCKQRLYSEEDTKIKIILPVLAALGFDPCTDLLFETPNKYGRSDIKIEWEGNTVILEAKKVSRVLTIKDEQQLFSYMQVEQSPFGILTNGKDWQFYANFELIKTINLEYGLYGDDLEFLCNFSKQGFNKQYLLEYNEFTSSSNEQVDELSTI